MKCSARTSPTHPLYEVEAALLTKTDGTISSVRERGEELSKTGRVDHRRRHSRRGAVIRTTKMGKQYARVVLEDLGGAMEVNFSANNFEKFSGFLAKDNIVLLKVRPSFDEELRFSALDVELLQFERGDGELHLSLRPEDLTQRSIATLREILTRYPGKSPVIVETGDSGKSFSDPGVQREYRPRCGRFTLESSGATS